MRSDQIVITVDTLDVQSAAGVQDANKGGENVPIEDMNAEIPFTDVSLESDDEDGQMSPSQEVCCRICMEAVKDSEFADGSAIRLGCKCLHEMDVVHLICAKKWFRLKRSLCCEVCGFPAKNLPETFQTKLRKLIEQTSQVGFRTSEEEESERGFVIENPQQTTFNVFVFGLLPALISFIVFNLFFHGVLDVGMETSIVLACCLSVVVFINFIVEVNTQFLHLAFVVTYIATVLIITTAFYFYYGWQAVAAAIAGTLIGPVTAVGIFAALRSACVMCFPVYHVWRSALV